MLSVQSRFCRPLPESSRDAAQPWLMKAAAHIETVAALEAIEMLALDRLRAAGGE